MPPAPSSTWFSQDPHWSWWVIGYFFIGGLAAGAYLVPALVDLVGDEADRRVTRAGYLIAFPLIVIAGLTLIVDLGRPERFWHMLWRSETGGPMLKSWSPMSLGSWLLLVSGGFAFLSFVGELVERGTLRLGFLEAANRAIRHGPVGVVYAALGAIFALALATYPGVLLAMTNRPLWADTTLLGAIFVASSTASGVAAIELANYLSGQRDPRAIHGVTRFGQFAIVVALISLLAMIVTLGPVAQLLASIWGVLLVVGVVLLGLLVPLVLGYRPRLMGSSTLLVAALLELAGGLLVRYVLVMSNGGVSLAIGS